MKLTLIFAAILAGSAARAQAPTEKVREKTEHAHLVGHEDALLLKRIEDAIAEWDPRNLTSPYLKVINTNAGKKYALRRPDLAEFIADPDAAVALGKALFWEMQAGSDFTPRTFRLIRWKEGLLGDLVAIPADAEKKRPKIVLGDLKIVVGTAPPIPLGDIHLEDFGGLESAEKLGDLSIGKEKLRDIQLSAEWIADNKVVTQSLPLSKVVAEASMSVAELQIKELEHLVAVGHELVNIRKFTSPSGTACASCHYRFGADARNKNTGAIAFQSWVTFAADRTPVTTPPTVLPTDTRGESPVFSQRYLPAPFNNVITTANFSVSPVDAGRLTPPPAPGLLQHEIIGSQGMVYRLYTGATGGVETSKPIPPTPGNSVRADMFAAVSTTNPPTNPVVDSEGNNRTRQITQRNSPSVVNAVFNDRQFHDGRAESTFNGFSIFGDFDKRVVLKKALLDATGKAVRYEPASIAIVNASLASQAVGPIVNEVEMSYLGRNFHDIAARVLSKQPLSQQRVSPSDSVFAPYANNSVPRGLFDPANTNAKLSYRTLIQRAFRKEWWADELNVSTQIALTSRLAALRGRVAAINGKLAASELEGPIRAAVDMILGDSNALPARRTVTFIKKGMKKDSAGAAPTPAISSLLKAAEEWELIEGEILPLRMDAVVSREQLDAALAATLTGGPGGKTAQDDLMVNNFSLYWGLSIMLYESTLISNDSPFDQMLRGNPKGVDSVFAGAMGQTMIDPVAAAAGNTAVPSEPPTDDTIRRVQLDKFITKNAPPVLTGTAMFQRGFRVFVQNCAECHEPPFFTSAANLELGPDLPDPIAKLHSHSLIRTALADAFKSRLVETGQPAGSGVTYANRHLLGKRRWFFDQERIPEVEASVADLMIELMGIPDRRPLSFNQTTPPPPLDRDPMITWANWITGGGTRPPLGFEPSPQPGEDPLDPYAFYDVGFYNIGVSEPRYDWGVWGFAGADEALTTDRLVEVLRWQSALLRDISPFGPRAANGLRTLNTAALNQTRLAQLKITPQELARLVTKLESGALTASDVPAATQDPSGIPSLGSAYRLPRVRRSTSDAQLPAAPPSLQLQMRALRKAQSASHPADHSTDRGYPDLEPNEVGKKPEDNRAEHHFFKRARRMVMTGEPWGHRKPFISDNELMGWGAFKAPSLRNVALTEPYMHNGRFLTLRQVLQFYSFDNTRLIPAHVELNPDLHPEMGRLALNSDGLITGLPAAQINLTQIQDSESLLFFLHCLTDERVQFERAPFDHPSIIIPNGVRGSDPNSEIAITVSEVGADGFKDGQNNPASRPQFPAGK